MTKATCLVQRNISQKGIFVDNEFPKEVQWSHTILRPVLKLTNKTDSYEGKCKMEGHH